MSKSALKNCNYCGPLFNWLEVKGLQEASLKSSTQIATPNGVSELLVVIYRIARDKKLPEIGWCYHHFCVYEVLDEASMQHFRSWIFSLTTSLGKPLYRKKHVQTWSNGTVTLRDGTKDHKPRSSVSTGDQQDHSVPGTSGIHGNLSKNPIRHNQM